MRILLFLAATLASLPSPAILIRADRADAEYLELATRYPSAIEIGRGIEGVLIASRWVLTSAAAAMRLREAKPRPPLVLGGRSNAVQAIFIHPEWRHGAEANIALVLLRETVAGIDPTPISRERDERDDVIRIVGHGPSGRIGSTERRNDGRKRAAINTVDRVAAATVDARVKPADEASDLQGAAVEGEEGAPAFVEDRGRILVVGVFAGNEGEWQRFARASTYAQWIDDTMFRAAVEEARTR